MIKFYHHAFLIGILFLVSIGATEPQVRVRGNLKGARTLANALKDVPSFKNAARNQTGRISLEFSSKQLGKVELFLNKFTYKDWNASFIGSFGASTDDSDIILIRGKIKSKNGWEPIGGSIYKVEGKPVLFILGQSQVSNKDFYLSVPLSKKGPSIRAEIQISDSVKGLEGHRCGTDSSHLISEGSSTVHSLRSRVSRNGGNRTAKISTVADPEYYAAYGSNTNNHIATLISAANAIYKRDLGVYLIVGDQRVYSSHVGNPYVSTDANVLLPQFKDLTIAENRQNTATAFHLFSGKDFDGSILGVAWVGTICRIQDYVFGVSQRFHPTSDLALFAHELGHNFGANHSDSGIMKAYLEVPGATNFSSASVKSIWSHLEGQTCLDNLPTPTPVATQSPTATPRPTLTPDNGINMVPIIHRILN